MSPTKLLHLLTFLQESNASNSSSVKCQGMPQTVLKTHNKLLNLESSPSKTKKYALISSCRFVSSKEDTVFLTSSQPN